MHPLNFPQPYQKPSHQSLLSCLQSLRVEPPIWNPKQSRADILREQEDTARDRREIAFYLSSIVSSPLDWLTDDDEREEIWSEASKRLSERCGRTAMGEITRRWPFTTTTTTQANGKEIPFELTIREPPLTGDSLGHKTWGSSYVLAQLLPKFAETSLEHLLGLERDKIPVLELGSGTGLLGIAAAALWRVTVVLTDLPEIMDNLRHNAEINREVVEGMGGRLEAAPLMWGCREESDGRFGEANEYKLVIVADPMYDDNHPELLAGAVHDQLALGDDARALIMVPLRDETTKRLLCMFRGILAQEGRAIVCINEGIEPGQDDWDEDDNSQRVDCWWGVFKRADKSWKQHFP